MTRDFTDSEIDRHDTLVDEGWKLVEGQLLIHGNPPVGKPGFLVRRRLQKAIGCFEEALEINPEGWQSMWALGKIHQRLQNDALALNWFRRAYELNPEQPDVCREAAQAAMNRGNAEDAVRYCKTAVRLAPEDHGLKANLALALLLSGEYDEALDAGGQAVKGAPEDRISHQVLRLISEVKAGSRPRTLRELEESM